MKILILQSLYQELMMQIYDIKTITLKKVVKFDKNKHKYTYFQLDVEVF